MQAESRTLRYPVDGSQAGLTARRLPVQYARRFDGSEPCRVLRQSARWARYQGAVLLSTREIGAPPRPHGRGFRAGEVL